MEYPKNEPTKEELLNEIKHLRKKLKSFERSKERAAKFRLFVVKKFGISFLLGARLKYSLNRILEGDLSKENISEVLMATLYRFTRIGLFAFLVAIIPVGILSIQTILLNRQNEKIDKQNVRLDQQTALLEADRRSAVILESGNVLDAVSKELFQSKDSSLSNPLIGRIIALSRAMKDYRYLDPEADTLIDKSISPERGHLLVSLYNSRLDSVTYFKIFKGANFVKADLRDTDLDKAYLRRIELSNGQLKKAFLSSANLREAFLIGADFQHAYLIDANLREALLGEANFFGAELVGADLTRASCLSTDFQFADLRYVDFRHARIGGANFRGANLEGAEAMKSQIRDFITAEVDTSEMIWHDE